jgi:hypothetical protein
VVSNERRRAPRGQPGEERLGPDVLMNVDAHNPEHTSVSQLIFCYYLWCDEHPLQFRRHRGPFGEVLMALSRRIVGPVRRRSQKSRRPASRSGASGRVSS